MTAANFARLDVSRPEVSRLVTAMLQAHQAVVQRSWSHPQEDFSDDWWADVLADPRARCDKSSTGPPTWIVIDDVRTLTGSWRGRRDLDVR